MKLKKEIIKLLEKTGKSLSVSEVADFLHLKGSMDFKSLVKTIAQMEKEGSIVFTKKGNLKLPQPTVLIEGTLRMNDRGFGFVTIDPEEDDVYIAKENVNSALNGDTVAIDILAPADPFSEKGAEGKVVEILKRSFTTLTGEFIAFDEELREDSSFLGEVLPKDKRLSDYPVYVSESGLHPVDGNIVVVTIENYPEGDKKSYFTGAIITILGHKNDPGMDILSLVTSIGIKSKFDEATLKQAQEIPETVPEEELEKRRDLTNETIVTIDGEDAKDLDDAVTVKKLDNGNFFLGVHIADVSHYVTEGSPLDKEAYERGTSVYLTDRVIPMIPQRLSNGICSLNPGVIRLTLSCEMEITPTGQVISHQIFPSYIKTTARMTYTAVNKILEEGNAETKEKYHNLVEMFETMEELHGILEAMRQRRGAINFEDRETKVVVDEKGHPIDIVLRQRGVGEKMIESFMLAANETVAKHFEDLHLPFIYRIHEAPKEEKLERFFEFISVFGLNVKGYKKNIDATALQNLLKEVEDKPEAAVVSTMLLRSMQQAKYDTAPVGHYGLGADDYTHFTSPIRRYPDLIVHRMIHSYLTPQFQFDVDNLEEKLADIALHSSQMERKAVDAERQVDAMKKAEFMAENIGETYEGVISSVTKFGLFVELENTIEGLIHISTLRQDYFHFMEGQMALVGERTRRVFRLGQKVKIKVVKSDPVTREIDFALIEEGQNFETFDGPKKKKIGKKGHSEKRGSKNSSSRHGKSVKKDALKPKKKGKKPFYKEVAKGKKKKRK